MPPASGRESLREVHGSSPDPETLASANATREWGDSASHLYDYTPCCRYLEVSGSHRQGLFIIQHRMDEAA